MASVNNLHCSEWIKSHGLICDIYFVHFTSELNFFPFRWMFSLCLVSHKTWIPHNITHVKPDVRMSLGIRYISYKYGILRWIGRHHQSKVDPLMNGKCSHYTLTIFYLIKNVMVEIKALWKQFFLIAQMLKKTHNNYYVQTSLSYQFCALTWLECCEFALNNYQICCYISCAHHRILLCWIVISIYRAIFSR